MWDILSFNRFITQDVLVFFYYVGAIVMPVLFYLFRGYLRAHSTFISHMYDKLYAFYRTFSGNQKVAFWLALITAFLCMELCWRMIFEAMIGYFDMHNYLYNLQHPSLSQTHK